MIVRCGRPTRTPTFRLIGKWCKMAVKKTNPYISEKLRAAVNTANKRAKRLRAEGVKSEALVIFENALQGKTAKIPRKATYAQAAELERIVTKFLGAKTSTVRGARQHEDARRKNFLKLLRDLKLDVSNETINDLERYMSGIDDISAILRDYVYNDVFGAAADIVQMGGELTSNSLRTALSNGLYTYIIIELRDRGVDIDDLPMGVDVETVVLTARRDGLDAAVQLVDRAR